MNQGYSIGASSVLTAMYRQDVAANNLANIETVGFKPDMAFTIPRQAARQEDGLGNLPSNALLEKLGAGVLLGRNRVSFAQGSLRQTGNPLDVAIEGDGFLQLGAPGDGKSEKLRLTRDGRLTLNKEGRLINAATGLNVLDATDQPITLSPTQRIEIDAAGGIFQGGSKVAELKFVDVPSRESLTKIGDGMFALSSSAAASRSGASGRIVQGSIEGSGVDPIRAMMAVQNAANSVGTAVRIMQINDELTGRAISTLGRISA
jgi:flagellar basal-body rod protein FlgF